jgi:hypothetical protein
MPRNKDDENLNKKKKNDLFSDSSFTYGEFLNFDSRESSGTQLISSDEEKYVGSWESAKSIKSKDTIPFEKVQDLDKAMTRISAISRAVQKAEEQISSLKKDQEEMTKNLKETNDKATQPYQIITFFLGIFALLSFDYGLIGMGFSFIQTLITLWLVDFVLIAFIIILMMVLGVIDSKKYKFWISLVLGLYVLMMLGGLFVGIKYFPNEIVTDPVSSPNYEDQFVEVQEINNEISGESSDLEERLDVGKK